MAPGTTRLVSPRRFAVEAMGSETLP